MVRRRKHDLAPEIRNLDVEHPTFYPVPLLCGAEGAMVQILLQCLHYSNNVNSALYMFTVEDGLHVRLPHNVFLDNQVSLNKP